MKCWDGHPLTRKDLQPMSYGFITAITCPQCDKTLSVGAHLEQVEKWLSHYTAPALTEILGLAAALAVWIRRAHHESLTEENE